MSASQWHRNNSCWIQKLPNELLSETFRYYVDLDDSPWRLTLVCKRWQHVALTTPSLWTCITVVDKITPQDIRWECQGRPRYSDGPSSVCLDIGEMGDAVLRAGMLPLSVDIITQNPEGRLEILLGLTNQVFGSSFVNRIEVLHIDAFDHADTGRSPIFCPLPNLKELEMLSMPSYWGYLLFKTVCTSSAETLHSLTLYPRVSYEVVEEALSVFTKLKRLQRCPLYWPNTHTPRITIPQLTELVISCQHSYLTRIQLPQLQVLRAYVLSLPAYNDDKDYRPYFPQLTDLQAFTSNTRWLEYLVAPKLEKLQILEVAYTRSRFPGLHLLSLNLFPTVKYFTFTTLAGEDGDGDPRDSLLISALQAVPNAISVGMTVSSSSKDEPRFRLQLLDRLGSMEEDEILCAKLQDLELICQTRRAGSLADYEIYLLQRIVDIRKDMGRALTRFIVHWDARGEPKTQRFV